MHFGLPQIIVGALLIFGLGINLAKDGEPRTGRYSFGWGVVAAGIHAGLLYWGGFFA